MILDRFYEGCQQLLGEIEALKAEIQGNRAAPRGSLTVSVSPAFGQVCLVPILKAFTQAFPEITLDISMDDRFVDPTEQGVDVVIRTGNLSDSANLIARQLVAYPLVACGSPSYFEQYGYPQHPSHLQKHTCLNFRNRSTGRFYSWSFAVDGEVERCAVSGSVVFDNADAIVRSAIAGLGLSQMPAYLATEAISNGNLVEVLKAYRPPDVPVWICYLDRRFVAPRIRSFVEFMATQKERFIAMCAL